MTNTTRTEFKTIFRELPSGGSEGDSSPSTPSGEMNDDADEQRQDLMRWEDDGGSVRH